MLGFLSKQVSRFVPSLLQPKPLISCGFATTSRQEKLFQDFTKADFLNPHKVNSVLERNVQKRSQRSQRGLLHGKQPKTGLQTCFSEKKSIRWWKVNVQEKWLYSDVLEKKIRFKLSTKAIRCIEKSGGLDNYILLTKPKNTDSLYGEYLRRLMMFKLQDPSFQVPYVQKSQPVTHKVQRRRQIFQRRPVIWHPKEIRHTDLTQLRMKMPHTMSRRELAEYKELEDLSEHPEKITLDHPLVKREYDKQMLDLAALEPERKKIMERLERYKSKKTLERIREACNQGLEEWENVANLK